MKSSLLLLAGFAAISLGSCSSSPTTETTTSTTPADSTGAAMTTTTTTTSDAGYHTRGDRMATRFASQNKISDAATLAKLKTAYYNRAKRYDEMITKFKADTTGMGAAKRSYMQANDQEFQTVLLVPAQYQAYQSSQSNYDESSNLDTSDQGAAASSATMPSADSTSTTTTSSTTTSTSGMSSGAAVKSSKTKLEDGSKVKVKDDGTVKLKDANGDKTKL
ncbi:MAG: hypothetical protein ACRYFK_02865 [Janthinobacterium lividum]